MTKNRDDAGGDRKQAQAVAYRALARRGYSLREMKEKLQIDGFSTRAVTAVIRELESRGYLDDRRLAMSWAHEWVARRLLGPGQLRVRLEGKGFDRELIDEVVLKVYGDCEGEQMAWKACRSRYERLGHPWSDQVGRSLSGYLLRRGYSPDVIEKVLNSFCRQIGKGNHAVE